MPALVGVKVAFTVQVSPVLYTWLVALVVQLPVPASAKSSPGAPWVSTFGTPIEPSELKVKVSVIASLVVPTGTVLKFTACTMISFTATLLVSAT